MISYWDDSGTHNESLIAIAATFVVDAGQVEAFERDWREARRVEGFNVFHMADFNGSFDEFADPHWADEDKRKRTLNRLICIAKTRSRFCASTAVDRTAYTEVILSDPVLRKMCGGHYTFAVHGCLDIVKQWRQQYAPAKKLKYIFDRMSKGKGEIIAIFDDYNEYPDNKIGAIPGGFAFEDKKEVVELQAADIFAWHMFQQMQEHELRGLPIRPELSYLMGMPHQTTYYTRSALEKFKTGIMASETYKLQSQKMST
jgi:hypothetical protein